MLAFRELRITPDSKYLIIDVAIDPESCFEDVILDSIMIDVQDNYNPAGPSDKAIIYNIPENHLGGPLYSIPDNNCNPVLENEEKKECFIESNENMKQFRLVLEAEELGIDLSNTMLFVYASAIDPKGSIINTPCAKDQSMIMGTVVNLLPLYRRAIWSIKELHKECSIPKTFIDNILKFKALELSIKTGNYLEAIDIWNSFKLNPSPINNCNCNGNI